MSASVHEAKKHMTSALLGRLCYKCPACREDYLPSGARPLSTSGYAVSGETNTLTYDFTSPTDTLPLDVPRALDKPTTWLRDEVVGIGAIAAKASEKQTSKPFFSTPCLTPRGHRRRLGDIKSITDEKTNQTLKIGASRLILAQGFAVENRALIHGKPQSTSQCP